MIFLQEGVFLINLSALNIMKSCIPEIKELSTIYDKESMNTFVSLYFDGRDRKFIRKRENVIESILRGEEKYNFEKTMNKIKEFLKRENRFPLAIFSSDKNNYFKVIFLPENIENALIVDSSPYIRPLAEMEDAWKSITLVLINSNHAKIYSVSCGKILEERELSAEIMNKHKKGGWSQARFQRLRKSSIHSFFVEVSEELQKFVEDSLIVAGPGVAKYEFVKILPESVAKRILGVVDMNMENSENLYEKANELILEKGEEEKERLIENLIKEILKNGLAVYGIDETMKAVEEGRVEILMVEKNYKIKGWICENCQIIEKGSIKKCFNCGGKVSEVDVIEEIIELAERMDTKVEFFGKEEMKKFGHIAGLLRYK